MCERRGREGRGVERVGGRAGQVGERKCLCNSSSCNSHPFKHFNVFKQVQERDKLDKISKVVTLASACILTRSSFSWRTDSVFSDNLDCLEKKGE